MSKKNGLGISKKNFPGLKRVENKDGIRVWEYQGKYFGSLKELDMSKNPSKYINMKFTPTPKESGVQIPEDVDVSLEINGEEVSKDDFKLNRENK